MMSPHEEGVQAGSASGRTFRLRTLRLAFLLALAASMAACRETGAALGSSPAGARANADALLFSLGARFGPVEAAPGYEEMRSKLSRSALVPSRLLGDSTLWSASDGEIRELALSGMPTSGGYLLGVREAAGPPREPGAYRRSTRLRALGDGQFEWTVRDELAVGAVSVSDLGAALTHLLRAAEHSDAARVRAAYESSLPRTARALGRLFTLDSIALAPAPEGGSHLSLAIDSHPKRIASEFPQLSRFLRRYWSPARIEVIAEDYDGVPWWTATLDRDRTRVRLRVHEGRLAPLDGPPRPIPDQLRVRARMATRIGIFSIGASDVVADVSLRRDPDDAGFTAWFRREPEWHFPPLVERFIRSSLRRPFEGEGAFMAYRADRSAGRTTLIREYRITVQESRILRWLGALGSGAFGDFRKGAEQEYDRFVGELFAALREDVIELLR